MPSNTVNAVSQQVSMYVPDGQTATVSFDGSGFSMTVSFFLDQGSGPSAVSLTPTGGGGPVSSTTTAGAWNFSPAAGGGGILKIQVSAWTSGTAIIGITMNGS